VGNFASFAFFAVKKSRAVRAGNWNFAVNPLHGISR
jgi:hypothetical protein